MVGGVCRLPLSFVVWVACADVGKAYGRRQVGRQLWLRLCVWLLSAERRLCAPVPELLCRRMAGAW